MPLWKKVESPTMPTTLRGSPALTMPWAIDTPPPMHRMVSIRESGASVPRL